MSILKQYDNVHPVFWNEGYVIKRWADENEEFDRILGVLHQHMGLGIIKFALEQCELNDKAHRPDHVLGVCINAHAMLNLFPHMRQHAKVIMAAALLHDIGCHINRKQHHLVGAGIVLSNQLFLSNFEADELIIISRAILKHRASWKGTERNSIEDLVAAADRGKVDVRHYLRRAVQYRWDNFYGKSKPEDIVAKIKEVTPEVFAENTDFIAPEHYILFRNRAMVIESIIHLMDKFGSGKYDYGTLPTVTQKLYGADYAQLELDLKPTAPNEPYHWLGNSSIFLDNLLEYGMKESPVWISEH